MAGRAETGICRRIAQLRLEVAGPRGKSAFAKQLGLSPSTYDYYESSRVPPAPVLVRIAEVAAVDLGWLLTGKPAAGGAGSVEHPVLQRAAALLERHPDAAGALGAFLEVLAGAMEFPGGLRGQQPAAAPPQDRPPAGAADPDRSSWIPILGRSAAGVPQFWDSRDAAAGITTLGELVARHARRAARSARPAVAEMASGLDGAPAETVQVIALSAPDGSEACEFISAGGLRARHPDAFAVRIDGESMAPDIRHGDVVVLSPTAPASQGRPCVVQLRGQIGVTCKLYRREGDTVHLVAVNEQFPPVSVPTGEVVWALRVLARVRT